MDKQAAVRLIQETFNSVFDEDKFRLFARNLFNDLDESKAFAYHGQYIADAFKDHVKQYKRVGKYTDPEGVELDVLVVYLKKETSLERARTMQRNFIAHYLKNRGEKDAAIVAFCTDGLEDWRFSYVRMEYRSEETESGKVKVNEDLTPARRYSFLVGKNEPNHTAQQQLIPLLEDDRNNPTLSDLEKAFNIESVTKEFFNKYKELFLKVHEELDAIVAEDKKIGKEFEDKLIDTSNFAKKLLGQIVFLYFIQKKGWLGVARDKAWGTGPRNFIRLLLEKAVVDYENFFNDILEPLFYEALALDRGEVSLYSRFKCKIPFLNGGLFEPINGYNWEETDILLKNETFAEILDTFDLYNFTVREDEPLEKEVAVDPEMLGKVFENLLEVKDRKSKGAYYTPREIVHYMCQQSLISYLDSAINSGSIGYERLTSPQIVLFGQNELPPADDQFELMVKVGDPSIPRLDIEFFIRQGDFGIQNDLTVEEKGRETKAYVYKLPEAIRLNAERIDKALADIKICDPAIGSGAFPVGMLHEIIRARDTLTTYFPTMEKRGESGLADERTPYNFKRHAIQESIYGVDIDPGAVDIAKLRLWLSLVVDEDDFRTIKPLPNLDYKIVCGNTLDGFPFQSSGLQELEDLKFKFFEETSPTRKKVLKANIDERLQKAFVASRKSIGYQVSFDAKMMFSEVFHAKQGFDVVIGNPPYIQIQSFSGRPEQDVWKRQNYSTYVKTGDVYCMFYEQGFNLLAPKGVLTFITSNKWMRANYGKAMRKFFMEHGRINQLIDFGDSQLFENATTYTNILIWRKDDRSKEIRTWDLSKAYDADVSLEALLAREGTCSPLFSLDSFVIANGEQFKIKKKIEKVGVPLKKWDITIYRGILTGMNEAFIINGKKKDELIAKDSKSAEIIRPILRGRDIKRYRADFADLWMIATFPALQIKIDSYLAVRDYLKSFGKQLEQTGKPGCRKKTSNKWFEVQDTIAYHAEFKKEKIVYAEIVFDSAFYYDTKGYYPEATSFLITGKRLKYLTALLNSTLLTYAFRTFYAGGDLRGNTFRYKKVFLENLPIPKIEPAAQHPFEILVDQILAAKKKDPSTDTSTLEQRIDEMVYKLYDLTGDEIQIIEQKRKHV